MTEAKSSGAEAIVIADMHEQAVNTSKNTTTPSSGQLTDQKYNPITATTTNS